MTATVTLQLTSRQRMHLRIALKDWLHSLTSRNRDEDITHVADIINQLHAEEMKL